MSICSPTRHPVLSNFFRMGTIPSSGAAQLLWTATLGVWEALAVIRSFITTNYEGYFSYWADLSALTQPQPHWHAGAMYNTNWLMTGQRPHTNPFANGQ